MIIAYTLSMPNVGSWNGKYTGDGGTYIIIRRYSIARNKEVLERVLHEKSHYYNFNDGWGALVCIATVDAKTARQLKKKSMGFRGYDWMIPEIETYGRILTYEERALNRREEAVIAQKVATQ